MDRTDAGTMGVMGGNGHPLGCRDIPRGQAQGWLAQAPLGKEGGWAVLVPGAIPREPCLAGIYLYHLQRQETLTLPFPVSTKSLFRLSSQCTALGWDGSLSATVAVLPWAPELPIPGLPRAPQGAAFLALCCALIRAGWVGPCYGSSAQRALPRQHCPGHAAHATATPARGEIHQVKTESDYGSQHPSPVLPGSGE